MGARGRVTVAALAVVFGRASAAHAGAAVLTVTTTQDELTAGDHQCSLREAVAAVDKHGSTTGVRSLSGVTPIAVTMTLRNLRAGTTYHYRLAATTSEGMVQGADRTFTTTAAPKLTRVTLASRRFKAGRGTTISYTDSQAAPTLRGRTGATVTVTFTIVR